MNQIKRKRRLTTIEVAVIANIAYLIIVAIFKSGFDIIGRTGGFNYLYNAIEFGVIGLFWIILFSINFKNIYAGEKPKYLRYIFFTLVPIMVLTVALTLVSMFWPGQDTTSVWNQFSFLAAPTIFWYLPFGLIYQAIGSYVSIYIFFGICLIITMVFQIMGMVLGRLAGRKYLKETEANVIEEKSIVEKNKKPKKARKIKGRKSRSPLPANVGMERLSDEMINEGFTPGEEESMTMTGVIIEDIVQSEDTELFKRAETPESMEVSSKQEMIPENQTMDHEIEKDSVIVGKLNDAGRLGNDVSQEWKVTQPVDPDKRQEELDEKKERQDKSFLKETSQIRIINEDDIEKYTRNKK